MTTTTGDAQPGGLPFPAEFRDDLARMADPKSDRDYYLFTLIAEGDSIFCDAVTHFVSFMEGREGWETREPSLVRPEAVLLTRDICPLLVVEGVRQFVIWNVLGGRALVERRTAEEFMPDRLEPGASAPKPSGAGFMDVAALTGQAVQYAPSRKLRMEILLRDNNRCRSCGRSPATNTDVELHVHHVRPWGTGGPTDPLNLLTLCQTCHRGLPGSSGWAHYQPALYGLIPGNEEESLLSRARRYQEGVLRYRQIIAAALADLRRNSSPMQGLA